VGVALPFSIASRMARGQRKSVMWLHAVWRALVLVLLGVFLRSIGKKMTYWTFEDTLSQIGLGYPFLFLLGFVGNKVRWSALVVLLVGYWWAFATFPIAPPDVDLASVNVPKGWTHDFGGFLAHWNMNRNAAWAFDRWFLNLFPRETEFIGNRGGYCTLSFIPTLGTMILGLIGGSWLRKGSRSAPAAVSAADGAEKVAEDHGAKEVRAKASPMEWVAVKLIFAGVGCLAAGWLLQFSGLCPIVKKIWTPAWTLYSGGWCFLLMAAFYFVIDLQGWKRWAFPLVVIGMNSIAMYVLKDTPIDDFFGDALHTHFGRRPFQLFGEALEPVVHGGAVLLILWLILLWMHRRKVWVRI
jgi:heparan-alpha-glucosaminide N-acetyltransferase